MGSRFRTVLDGVQQGMSDVEVGRFLLESLILVHLPNFNDKFQTLCLMIEKLYSAVSGECECDSLDSVANQEVLLGGHLYASLLSEKLYDLLIGAKAKVLKDLRNSRFDTNTLRSQQYLKKLIDQQTSIGKKMEHFLATGNLISRSNLDLQQTAGFTVVADKLNMVRYLSHFRSIHRGQYFTEMKTTTVRKLLPEAWGFTCPVHTPDGSPCGLLNHITLSCAPLPCEEMNAAKHSGTFKRLLVQLGMNPVSTDFGVTYPSNFLPVVLDGRLMGYIEPALAPLLVQNLRGLKISQQTEHELYGCVPRTLEIAFLASDEVNAIMRGKEYVPVAERKEKFFPGIFLATTPARFVRPVKNLEIDGIEFIGPLEQVNLSIACLEEDLRSDSTHKELDPLNMLSIIASTIPFADYNQSPRNMYQC